MFGEGKGGQRFGVANQRERGKEEALEKKKRDAVGGGGFQREIIWRIHTTENAYQSVSSFKKRYITWEK